MQKITVRYRYPTRHGATVFGRQTFKSNYALHQWLFSLPKNAVVHECVAVGVSA